MTMPGVWSEGRWLVEPETGRRVYVVADLEPGEHAPVSPGPAGRPPLLAWVLICASGALVALGALAALLVVGFDSPAAAALNWAVIIGGLGTMVLCAVAAARLHDAYRRPLELGYRPVPQPPPVAPVRHLRSAARPALGKGAPLD